MNLTQRPKDTQEWKSNKYRRWIRNNRDCFLCGNSLLDEKPEFITHHHKHAGGQHPRDSLLVPLCLGCHNKYHAGEALTTLSDDVWMDKAIACLAGYVDSMNINARYVALNALAIVAEENE